MFIKKCTVCLLSKKPCRGVIHSKDQNNLTQTRRIRKYGSRVSLAAGKTVKTRTRESVDLNSKRRCLSPKSPLRRAVSCLGGALGAGRRRAALTKGTIAPACRAASCHLEGMFTRSSRPGLHRRSHASFSLSLPPFPSFPLSPPLPLNHPIFLCLPHPSLSSPLFRFPSFSSPSFIHLIPFLYFTESVFWLSINFLYVYLLST